MAKAPALSVLSALLGFAVVGMGGAVRAEDTCLPAPTGKTPPGSHWHYRTDPVKQTKCWYLRSQGDAAQPAATGDGADAAGAPAPAAPPAPKPARPHQAAKSPGATKPSPPPQAPVPAQNSQLPAAPTASAMQGAPASASPAPGAAPWPDPRPPASTGGVAWPSPPAVAPSAPTAAAGDPGGTTTAAEQGPPGQETGSITATGTGEAPAQEVTPPPAPSSDVSGSTILMLAAAMAIVGVLMRWLLGKLFARRRRIAAERREPVWVTDEYVMPDALTRGPHRPQGRVDPERLDDEVKQALRKLLRTLERSAA